MTRYIDVYREEFGVEPICDVLQFAPSTYDAAKNPPLSQRAVRDEELKPEIRGVFEDNCGVCGARKVYKQLHREEIGVPAAPWSA